VIAITSTLLFYFEMESLYVAQAGLEHLGLSNLPASATLVAGSVGMYHHSWLIIILAIEKIV
jgi:hypothetical protein